MDFGCGRTDQTKPKGPSMYREKSFLVDFKLSVRSNLFQTKVCINNKTHRVQWKLYELNLKSMLVFEVKLDPYGDIPLA